MNRRVGAFDLTPEPAVHDLGEVWLLANETLVPDASRFYRSRPNNFRNPLMTPEGAPSVAFRWMEVEGPLYDDSTLAGYRLLFGDLPLHRVAPGEPGVAVPVVAALPAARPAATPASASTRSARRMVDVVSADPAHDARSPAARPSSPAPTAGRWRRAKWIASSHSSRSAAPPASVSPRP
jgi:hypothetical protein